MTEASIVLNCYNDSYSVERLVENLRREGDFEIIVVDDSSDRSMAPNWVREGKDVYLFSPNISVVDGYDPEDKYVNVRPERLRLGYLMGREIGYQRAKYDPVIIMDNDLEMPAGWWGEFKKVLEDSKVGVVGPLFNGKHTHSVQNRDQALGIYPGQPFFEIQFIADYLKYMGFSELDHKPEKLNWGDFLTDVMLCFRRKCLTEIRNLQLIYKDSTWLANAAYKGSSGLFHYPLGTYTAMRNGWKVGVLTSVVAKHG